MRYRVLVYRADEPFGPPQFDRAFTFNESSHKVVDVITIAIRQLEGEGGDVPRDYTAEAYEALERLKQSASFTGYGELRTEDIDAMFIAGFEAGRE